MLLTHVIIHEDETAARTHAQLPNVVKQNITEF